MEGEAVWLRPRNNTQKEKQKTRGRGKVMC